MKLNATVDNIRSARTTQTGKEQAVVKVKDTWHNIDGVYLNNDEGWAVDDKLVILVLTKEQAVAAYDHLVGNGADPAVLDKVIDQLRPDEPPPFLFDDAKTALEFTKQFIADVEAQPDTTTTQEFEREVER